MDRIVTAKGLGEETFDVTTRSDHRFVVKAGAQSADDPGPAPMELMLASVATCSAATIEAILAKMRLPLAGFEVAVAAKRATESPRVWTDVDIRFHLRSEAPLDRLQRAVELSSRTCSAAVMIARAANTTESLYVVQRIPERDTVPLRHAILRAGQPLSAVAMHGDDVATWFGVLHNGAVHGTIGLFDETSPEGDSQSRLRGMTTSKGIRGTGLGRLLVDALVDQVRDEGGDSMWCAARVEAAGFYEKLGFERVSEVYEVEDLGPHVRMRRAL